MMSVLGFIGTGNMGGALALAAAQRPENRLRLANRSRDKLAALAEKTGGEVCDNTGALLADYVFLGVKPGQLKELLPALTERLRSISPAPVLVSMAACTSIEEVETLSGKACPVIRIMPNTPVSIGRGTILYSCSDRMSPEAEQTFLKAMSAAGRFIKIEEKYMDAGACISGCGPAFVDLMLEALADGGVACGLPRSLALELAAAMTAGAAELALETGKHPARLKDEVCSPGGTTIQGVRALERGGFRSSVMEAVLASFGAGK